MVHWLIAPWALHGALLASGPTNADAVGYEGYALIEVQVPDADSLALLLAMGVDPWVESARLGAIPVLVSPDRRAAIDASGWSVRVLSDDVQPVIDDERERLAARTSVQHGGDPFADYVPLDDVNAMLDGWAAAAPELATVIDVGVSIEGRTIRGLRIGTGDGESPAMLVIGGQHAREWISVTTALWIAARFVEDAADPEIAGLLAGLDVVVVPVVNPDGYVWSWESQRLWRKNRRDGVGVDTNRNFGYGWGGEGAGFEPEAENYAGPEAFSEPESAAIRDFVLAHDEVVSFVDLHSFGQLLMWPWGHIYEPAPDADAFESMGGEMAEAMYDVHQMTYTAIQGVSLYPAAGNSIDWAYGDEGLRAYTIELRPTQDVPEFEVGFILDPDQIVPVGEEAMAAILVLAQWSAEQGEGDTGGETTTGAADTSTTAATTIDTGDDANDGTSGGASATDATLDDSGPQTATASATAADDSSSSGANEDDDASGCGCTSEPDASALGLAVLAIASMRRRRRSTSAAAR